MEKTDRPVPHATYIEDATVAKIDQEQDDQNPDDYVAIFIDYELGSVKGSDIVNLSNEEFTALNLKVGDRVRVEKRYFF